MFALVSVLLAANTTGPPRTEPPTTGPRTGVYKIRTPFTVNTISLNQVCNVNMTGASVTHSPQSWCKPTVGSPACIVTESNEWQRSVLTKKKFSIILFGDSGSTDNSKCPGAASVYEAVNEEKNKDLIVHLGDHSYADGNFNHWHTYVANANAYSDDGKVPIAPVVGNHEYDYENIVNVRMLNDPTMLYSDIDDISNYVPSFAKSDASKGECGVPFNSFFTFANRYNDKYEQGPFWYDLQLGDFAKIYVLSSEHDIHKKSIQGQWLRKAMKNDKDNKAIKWRVLCIHRPLINLFVDSKTKQDDKVAVYHFKSILDVLDDIDLMFTGHQHLYARVKNKFIHQITIGTGGRQLEDISKNYDLSHDVKSIKVAYGYGVLSVDKDNMCFQFKSVNNTIMDAFCK